MKLGTRMIFNFDFVESFSDRGKGGNFALATVIDGF